jgi:uncharacterized membrane protein YfcA
LEWLCVLGASFGFGLSKTGIPGVGILGVALFALVKPKSNGIALPLLIVADFVAGYAYFRYAVWSKMLRMFPWAAAGVLGGFWLLGRVPGQLNLIIGWILIILCVCAMYWRWFRAAAVDPEKPAEHSAFFEIATGILAGFTTMIANAAGPIMILYLLRMRLPKLQFIATCSCFFLVLNVFKVPFLVYLGLIDAASLRYDLPLFPVSLLGAFVGWWLLKHINQALFEALCLIFTLVAAVYLVR